MSNLLKSLEIAPALVLVLVQPGLPHLEQICSFGSFFWNFVIALAEAQLQAAKILRVWKLRRSHLTHSFLLIYLKINRDCLIDRDDLFRHEVVQSATHKRSKTKKKITYEGVWVCCYNWTIQPCTPDEYHSYC